MKEIDKSLGSAFAEAARLSDADELEISLRPRPYSRENLGSGLIAKARHLLRQPDVRDIASQFKMTLVEPGQPASTVDLLGDKFIVERRIMKQNSKTRVLDSTDAYMNIEESYANLKDELQHAATLAAGKE